MKAKYTASSREFFTLDGSKGGFEGQHKIRLSSPSTLVFKLNGRVGRYVENPVYYNMLVWEDCK